MQIKSGKTLMGLYSIKYIFRIYAHDVLVFFVRNKTRKKHRCSKNNVLSSHMRVDPTRVSHHKAHPSCERKKHYFQSM